MGRTMRRSKFWVAYVLCSPEDDHALQQRGTRTGSTGEQVQVRLGGRLDLLSPHDEAIFAGVHLKEAHLAADVVQRTDEKIHGTIGGVLLAIVGLWQTDLADQGADEANEGT